MTHARSLLWLREIPNRVLGADATIGVALQVLALQLLVQCVSAHVAVAQTQHTIIPPICATEEASVLTLIEDHAAVEDVAPTRLTAAFEAMLDARAACYAGRIEDAVAQYDAILNRLGRLHIGRKE